MNPQFLIAKLAANATESAWSQAYSTLNFYVVLSVQTSEKTEKPLAQIGKELLERLQREYFSLDEKTLESIKKAVENSVETVESTIKYSLVLTTNSGDTLYIITAGLGKVSIKRDEKLGIIANGEEQSVLSFSGPIQNQDIIIIQTADFSTKVPATALATAIDSFDVTDISENIAPHIHNDATGGEAAIVLLYSNPETNVDATVPVDVPDTKIEPANENLETESEPATVEPKDTPHLSAPLFEDEAKEKAHVSDKKSLSPRSAILWLVSKKKMFIGITILLLVFGLIGTIILRNQQQKSTQNSEAINAAVAAAQTEYEEGEALEPLNRPLALDKYNKAHTLLTDIKQKYSDDEDIKNADALLTKVEQKLTEFSAGKKVDNGKKLTSAKDLKMNELHTITVIDETLLVSDKTGTISQISENGELEETFTIDKSAVVDLSANSDYAFLLTDNGVTRVDLKTGSESELFELDQARQALSLFGSNIYLAHSSQKMIEKYAPSGYQASDYLKEPLPSNPVSIAIDGSVFVLYENGKLGKFTRGISDGFNVTGLQGAISNKSMIYTQEDYSSLYILDPSNQRLLIAAKNGEVKQEFSWDVMKNATDFAVNESSKTVYLTTPSELYTFTF